MASQRGGRDKVDLNQAGPQDLEQIDGVDGRRARLIIEHRDQIGAFRTWDDVERVEGIGHTLLEQLRASATLGQEGPGAPDEPSDVADVSEQEEVEMVMEEVLSEQALESQQRVLTALAQMDLEAAEAYRIAAESFVDDEISEQLGGFRDDHLKHVDTLERLITAMGGDPLDREGVQESVLASLSAAAAELGPGPVLLAMVGNERLTNTTYESILTLDWDDEIKHVLERNLRDEKRHLRWLDQNRDRVVEEEGPSPQSWSPP